MRQGSRYIYAEAENRFLVGLRSLLILDTAYIIKEDKPFEELFGVYI